MVLILMVLPTAAVEVELVVLMEEVEEDTLASS